MSEKIFSGRWLLTLLVGLTYVYCAVTGKLDYKDIIVITLIVTKEYFDRKDRNEKSNDDGPNRA